MATVTPNFNWPVPTSTDLVKDGATAIEALGDSIDASLVDLKGGTTGQVLSKNSNTDMDFTWVTDPGGDITGVTAGTGISGGGTSGDVTITNSMATAIDAKGDLVVGTGADAFDRLAVGTNNQVLTADSSTATGLKWATPAGGGGKILQVVSATYATETNSTSNTYIDSGLSASITPSSTSSRILVMVSQNYRQVVASSGNELGGFIKLMRSSTDLISQLMVTRAAAYSSELQHCSTFSYQYVDSPASTSALTYKTQFKNSAAVGTFAINIQTSSIILMEIGA